MEICGVKIGDRFRTGKNTTAVVVDFYKVTSMTEYETIKFIAIAKPESLSTNEFEVPFSTVMRNKIQ